MSRFRTGGSAIQTEFKAPSDPFNLCFCWAWCMLPTSRVCAMSIKAGVQVFEKASKKMEQVIILILPGKR